MVASVSAELVFFAIKSAVRLGRQARQAYVDATRRRDLVLPLPNYDPTEDAGTANFYFLSLEQDGVTLPFGLSQLLQTYRAANGLPADEEAKLLDYYHEYQLQRLYREGDIGTSDGAPLLDADAFNRLVTVRQWARGSEQFPSTLQRLAGTFIDIGVDYFVSRPGRPDENSREGKALIALLAGFDRIEFAEIPLGELPGKLFMATMETVAENAALLTSDAKLQELIQVTSGAMVLDVGRRIKDIRDRTSAGDEVLEGNIVDWAELVFRSILSSGGGLVIKNPRRFLEIEKAGQAALVTNVGEAVLDMVLADDALELGKVFGLKGLETVTKAALETVALHPELVLDTDNRGLKELLKGVVAELSRFDTILSPDVLPDLTRLILEKTGENLPLIWPEAAADPRRNLLLTAAAKTLAILSESPNGKPWSPRFGKDDLITVVDAVLDEVVANPGWILDEAGEINANLEAALAATLGVLRDRADRRLTKDTGVAVLKAAVLAVSLRQEFMTKIGADEQLLVGAVLALVLDTVFAADTANDEAALKVRWRFVRRDTIEGLVRTTYEVLGDARLEGDVLGTLRGVLTAQVTQVANGEAWNLEAYRQALTQAFSIGAGE